VHLPFTSNSAFDLKDTQGLVFILITSTDSGIFNNFLSDICVRFDLPRPVYFTRWHSTLDRPQHYFLLGVPQRLEKSYQTAVAILKRPLHYDYMTSIQHPEELPQHLAYLHASKGETRTRKIHDFIETSTHEDSGKITKWKSDWILANWGHRWIPSSEPLPHYPQNPQEWRDRLYLVWSRGVPMPEIPFLWLKETLKGFLVCWFRNPFTQNYDVLNHMVIVVLPPDHDWNGIIEVEYQNSPIKGVRASDFQEAPRYD